MVKLTGKKPGTTIKKRGKSCTYGITLLKGSPNPEAGIAFFYVPFECRWRIEDPG